MIESTATHGDETGVVLVALRSQAEADALLPLLRAIARGRRAPLHFLEVHRPETGTARPSREFEAEGWVDGLAVQLRREGIDSDVARRTGYNFAGVLREAIDEQRPELLVVPWSPGPERALGATRLRCASCCSTSCATLRSWWRAMAWGSPLGLSSRRRRTASIPTSSASPGTLRTVRMERSRCWRSGMERGSA